MAGRYFLLDMAMLSVLGYYRRITVVKQSNAPFGRRIRQTDESETL